MMTDLKDTKKTGGESEPPKSIKILSSENLFEGKKEIVITHNNHFYRLLITKSGKLILNK